MVPDKATIGFVCLEIYPTTAGGVGILLFHTISRLLEDGHAVALLVDLSAEEVERLKTGDKLAFANSERLHIFSVAELACDPMLNEVVFPDAEIERAARIASAAEALLERMPLDLLEFYDYCGPASSFLGRMGSLSTRTVVRLHNTIELIDRKIRNAPAPERLYHYAMERAQLAAADGLLTPGHQYFRQEIKPLYGPLAEHKTVMVSPPITRSIGEVDYDGQGRDIVFYGRLSTFKGLDTFLFGACLALQDEAFAAWAGDFLIIGPEETVAGSMTLEDLKAAIPEAHAQRFRFLGRQSHKDLLRHLSNAAFACFANRMESYCYAAHELHLAGIPLILRDTAAFRDHFKEGENAVFFDGTAADLAQTMTTLSRDPQLRLRLSNSRVRNGPRYRRNAYPDHLTTLLPRQTGVVEGQVRALAVTAFILSAEGEDGGSVERTVRSASPFVERIAILRPDAPAGVSAESAPGRVRFAGSFWRATSPEGASPLLEGAGDALIVLRAGDELESGWFEEARTVLARRPGLAGIGGWIATGEAVQFNLSAILPEAALTEPAGMRVLMRLPPTLRIGEVLALGGGGGDMSIALAHRKAGRVTLDMGRVAVDATQACSPPYLAIDDVIRIEADRLDGAYLSMVRHLRETVGAPAASLIPGRADEDLLLQTRMTPGLAILRTRPDRRSGEVTLRRLFREGKGMSEPWSAVTLSGPWEERREPTDPSGGSYRTIGSAQAVFHADGRSHLEVLAGPFCGALEVYFKGTRTSIDLHAATVKSGFLDFARLARGLIDQEAIAGGHGGEGRMPTALRALLAQGDGRARTIAVQCKAQGPLAASIALSPGVLAVNTDDLGLMDGAVPPATAKALRFLAEQKAWDRLIVPVSLKGGPVLVRAVSEWKAPVRICVVLEAGPVQGLAPLEADDSVYADDMKRLADWFGVARRLGPRLEVVAQNQAYLPLFEAQGCTTRCLPAPLESPAVLSEDASDGTELLILPGSGLLPSLTHMIAAWMLFEVRVGPVDQVWIPSQAATHAELWQSFAPRGPVTLYDAVPEVMFAPRYAKAIALGVYPDTELPADLPEAIAGGFIPILGPGRDHLRLACGTGVGGHVTYWDNARDIALELERVVGDVAREAERLRLLTEERRRIFADALSDWFGPSTVPGAEAPPEDSPEDPSETIEAPVLSLPEPAKPVPDAGPSDLDQARSA